MENLIFKDAQEVFQNAINTGRLSENENAANFAGLYMYMGTEVINGQEKDLFKHIDTRKHLK